MYCSQVSDYLSFLSIFFVPVPALIIPPVPVLFNVPSPPDVVSRVLTINPHDPFGAKTTQTCAKVSIRIEYTSKA